jgi:hypothetical protein
MQRGTKLTPLVARSSHGRTSARNICVGFADVTRAKLAYDVRHVARVQQENVARTAGCYFCTPRLCAIHGVLFKNPPKKILSGLAIGEL